MARMAADVIDFASVQGYAVSFIACGDNPCENMFDGSNPGEK
jgi:hypothetical protein